MAEEVFFTATEIARTLPGHPDPGTIRFWMQKGIVTRKGRVCLKYERTGTRFFTTSAWVEEFFRTIRENGVAPKRVNRQIMMAL